MSEFDGSLKFDTKIDSTGFESGLKLLKGGLAALGIGKLGKEIIATGKDFESAMSKVSAIAMATEAEYKMLADAAKEMGARTQFSASQAANALEYLALAGYSAEESVEALPKVLNLAASGGLTMARASELLVDSMAVMGLGISDMDNFTDQLAMAASKSNTSIAQLGEAVLVAGGQASLAGMDVDDMNTALGILADNGIKGSEGGTALRNALKNLYTPTKASSKALEELGIKTANSDGSLRKAQDVLKDLNKALSGLTADKKIKAMGEIFDTRTIAAANALLKNSGERWDELNGYLTDCEGAAGEMAETLIDNLAGKLEEAGSAAEGLGIRIYEHFQEPMKDAVSSVTEKLGELDDWLENGGMDKIGDFAEDSIPGVAGLVAALVTYGGTIKAIAAAQAILNAVMSANPLGLAASAAVGLTVAYYSLEARQSEEAKLLEDEREKLSALISERQDLIASTEAQAGAELAKCERTENLWRELKELADATGKVKDADRERANYLAKELAEATGLEISLVEDTITGYQQLQDEIDNLIAKQRAEVLLTSMHAEYKAAVTQRTDALTKATELQAKAAEHSANVTRLQLELEELEANGKGIYWIREKKDAIEEEMACRDEALSQYSDYMTVAEGCYKSIATYEKMQVAAANESYDELEKIYARKTRGYEDLSQANTEELLKQYQDTENYLTNLKKLYQTSNEDQREIIAKDIEAKEKQLDEIATALHYKGLEVSSDYMAGIMQGIEEKTDEVEDTVWNAMQRIPAISRQALDEHSPSKVGENIGANWDFGVAGGIEKYTYTVTDAAESLGYSLIGATEKYQNELNRVTAKNDKDEAKRFTAALSEKLRKASTAAEKAAIIAEAETQAKCKSSEVYLAVLELAGEEEEKIREREFKNLENALDLELITEKEYYSALETLRDKYFKEGTDEWEEYTLKIAKYNLSLIKTQKQAIADVYNELTDEAKDRLGEIYDAQQSLEEKLEGYGNLFRQNTIVGEGGSLSYISIDPTALKEQNALLAEYNDSLLSAKARIDEYYGENSNSAVSLYSLLRDMPIEEALGFANALNSAGDGYFATYLDEYSKRLELSSQIAENLYSDDVAKEVERTAENMAADMYSRLSEKFGCVPEDFFAIGENALSGFYDGFMEDLSAVFGEIRAAINAELATFSPNISMDLSSAGGGVTDNSSITYNLYGSDGQDTLRALNRQKELEKVLGI